MRSTVLALVVAAGCGQHLNPEYCATHAGECPTDSAPIVDAPACTMDEQCGGGVCDLSHHLCVECLPSDNPCRNPTPVCSADDKCVPITCASNVALPDGSCADLGRILFAGPDGTAAGNDCSTGNHCTLADALLKLATGGAQDIVHLDDGTYTGPVVLAVPHHVIFLGIHPVFTGGGPVVTVPSGSDVELDYLTFTGATGGGVGLACATGATLHAYAIQVTNNKMGGFGMTSACALTLDTATISGNTHGGLSVTAGSFDVRNSLFLGNGDNGLNKGPVDLVGAATDTFRFNNVYDNTVKSGGGGAAAAGVVCSGGAQVDGNIINFNHGQGMQATGCDFSKSYVMSPDNSALLWVNVAAGNYHLTSTSPTRNVAGLTCNGYKDMDGEARPMGGNCDQGADEFTEP